jgi:hypothetical protein
MIQIVDFKLKDRLRGEGVRVRSDARISTGISKPSMLNWVRHARRQVRAWYPDVTVVFLGANDGFPINGAPCCGERWMRGYASRARRMMATYRRRGKGRVYWLTLPTSRRRSFAKVFFRVNRAVRRARRRFKTRVRILELTRLFTPHGRFRQRMRWRGRTVTVRQGDGVHLSVAGASIAAEVIEAALRRDRVIR